MIRKRSLLGRSSKCVMPGSLVEKEWPASRSCARHAIGAAFASALLAAPALGAVIEVPNGQPTVAAAIAAANSGDEIVITNSDTYVEGTLTFNKQLTLAASPGQTPTIESDGSTALFFMAEGSNGTKIGSNDGGRITIDAASSSRDMIRLATVPADSVEFENLNMINPQATTSGVALLAFSAGSNVAGVGSATFRDVFVDMKGTGGRAFRLATTAAASTYTFERVEVVNVADGQDPFILGVNGTALHGGTLNVKDSRIFGGARSVYLFENSSKPQWDINIEDSLFRTRASVGAVGIRIDLPNTGISVVRSAFASTGASILFNGNTRPVGDDGSQVTIDQSDLVSSGDPAPEPPAIPPPTVLIQPPITSAGDRGFLVTNSILYNTTTANNVVVVGEGSNDEIGGNNNNAFPGGYEDFSSTADVSPAEEPLYQDLAANDFRYSNTTFLTASATGGHIGSRRNFQLFLDETPPPSTLGDLNGDGVINVIDVTALGNAVADGTTIDLAVGDINEDGEITVDDVDALAQIVVNATS